MTEPIDKATKDLIDEEAEHMADSFDKRGTGAHQGYRRGYTRGATVWAEKLKQEKKESYKTGWRDGYDDFKINELKQERNKVIDECIEIVRNSNHWDACGQKLIKLKDKSHEAKTKDSQKPY